MNLYPVLLSGGSGTRLWPLSRATFPKQFLKLPPAAVSTLFQETALRFAGRQGFADPIVVCSEAHRFIVTEQLEDVDCTASEILLEPAGRSTAPAVTVAALAISKIDRDGVMVVMPSDHVISDLEALRERVASAAEFARQGKFVLFGIPPSSPCTGFGYIEKGAPLPALHGEGNEVASFIEKPDFETASGLVERGNHYWNSGIFVLSATACLKEVQRLHPEILDGCQKAYKNARVDLGFTRLEPESFEKLPTISLDHAVMEESPAAAVLRLEAGWTDIGSWTAIADLIGGDDNGNVACGDAILEDSQDCIVYTEDRLIAGIGLEGLVVVDTPDALLIAAKNSTQKIGSLVAALQDSGRTEHQQSLQIHRPWGYFERICLGPGFQVKRLHIKGGGVLSLQRHKHRSEHWVVTSGTAQILHGERVFRLQKGESTYIPANDWHRIENPSVQPLEIIEIQIGSHLGEDDIERDEDIYGRTLQNVD